MLLAAFIPISFAWYCHRVCRSDNIVPPNDVPIIGSTTRVLIKKDLHPQIIELLLKTMVEEHGGPGIFRRSGNSPTPTMWNIPLPRALSIITTALRPARHLPLWLTVHAQRAIAALVTIVAIGLPLFNFAPKLYLWFVKSHMAKLYRRLRVVEMESQAKLTIPKVVALQTELENIDQAASILPMRHSDLFFDFNRHIKSARIRLAARLVEARRQTVKAA